MFSVRIEKYSGKGATGAILLSNELCQEIAQCHDKAHILYFDNWYGSAHAAELVHEVPRKMHCVMTMKANKKKITEDAIFRKTGPMKMECYKSVLIDGEI